jgi:ZIP family zinc transporter
MIFVVVEKVIPEAQRSSETNITSMAAMLEWLYVK